VEEEAKQSEEDVVESREQKRAQEAEQPEKRGRRQERQSSWPKVLRRIAYCNYSKHRCFATS
jgi:hypothetical protein